MKTRTGIGMNWFSLLSLSTLFTVPVLACSGEPGGGDQVRELWARVEQADAAHDISREQELLEAALGAEGSSEEFGRVERRLARLAWKYHRDFDRARDWIEKAATRPEDRSEAWLEAVRMEGSRSRFSVARTAAEKAVNAATTDLELRDSRLALAGSIIQEAIGKRFAGDGTDERLIADAQAILRELVHNEPGGLEAARLLIAAGIFRDDGADVSAGWNSFYHVTSTSPAPNLVSEAGKVLEDLMNDWNGAKSGREERTSAVIALADSRLFTEAALIALDPRSDEENQVMEIPRVSEIVAYARFCRNVDSMTNEYYRQTILGQGTYSDFEGGLRSEIQTLWKQLVPPVSKAPGRAIQKSMNEELGPRFGTELLIERVSGYRNIKLGHRVIDDSRVVEQYGHRAELRFVSLGTMVSNGYGSWAWNNGAMAGGWARNPTITQVRHAYASNPLSSWRLLTDEHEIAEVNKEIERESELDNRRAGEDPYAYLPGLALRLRKQGREQLLERLSSSGLQGDDLRMAFLAEYERVTVESSIFAHEGRHAIHKARRGFLPAAGKEKEFRAKLSEVVFAPEPRLSLGAIISSNIGSDSSHGQANLRIVKGLVSWMRDHATEISNFDPSRPVLPQFDRLTDQQVREAFRSMDPLAKR